MALSSKTTFRNRPRVVGLLGGGIIGSGWAAKFILEGVDVRLYDPAFATPLCRRRWPPRAGRIEG
ncbi:3-hydroxyacyl-CoA dehydrogenase NAD-binding domain-containing protein [Bradyrhizobium cajani]|uniref:3-hydroxyacyl-CoA dehydrogenase NAD-binding domain-containing protein n=1 Tax=Bradyrhizobium cajani TaxID=1928661 RepID=UPI0024BFF32F|nr:3-hydroxyacyl-CoA dehydrogenase NAD-binding domain-containing protein [Bradyrhizobium cajani]